LKFLLKSAGTVSLSILLSRITGLFRDVVVASTFGASPLTDAFFVAFRIPNLLRRIFAEGAFSSAFTPSFSRLVEKDFQKAKVLAEGVLFLLIVALGLVLLFGELLAGWIIKLTAPGFSEGQRLLATSLLREMFPYIVLVSLVAFCGAILNSFKHFFAPSFSTVLFNISIIISVVLLSKKLSVHSIALGVIAGGILQLILQIPFLLKKKFFPKPKLFFTEETYTVLKNIVPGIFGFGVRQVSMLIDTFLASFLTVPAVSYLYYANRLVQLPLGMFAIAISQVILPSLSRLKPRSSLFVGQLLDGLELCFAVVVPSVVGLLVLGTPIVDMIYAHGTFSEQSTIATGKVLFAYALGLAFFSVEKILTNASFSAGDYSTPVKISSYTLIFNFFASGFLCFVLNLSASGLALGTSLTSAVNSFLLLKNVERITGFHLKWKVLKRFVKYATLSLSMLPFAIVGKKLYPYGGSTAFEVLIILGTVLVCACVYFAVLFATGNLRRLLKGEADSV
jgi:putative peptidoglycan lipid II flippase